MKTNNYIKIITIICSIAVVAILGSIFVNLGMDWFNSLIRPSQWIPNIIIPIVWTIIYSIFAILLSVWSSKENIPIPIIVNLIINGVLNILWCLLFFTLELTFVGNIAIVLNLIAGIVLFIQIFKTKRLYSYFIAIYPLWLSLATTLNLALWILN